MADVDYPGGRTDWERHTVAELAGFLDEDLGSAWTHVRAWSGTAEMAGGYGQALRRVRDGLAKIWPPERSPAAAAYLSRMDALIASLDDMHEVAVSNGAALKGILETLEGAKRQVDQLLEQWKVNQASVPDPAYASGEEPWPGELSRQAAQRMHETDAAVYEYGSRMVEPHPFQPGPPWFDPARPVDGSGGSAGSAGGGLSGGGRSVRPPEIAPVPSLSVSHPAESRAGAPAGSGPVLSGGPVPGGGEVVPGGPAGGGQGSAPASGSAPGSGPSASWFVDTPRGRVLRAGGVIGPVSAPGNGFPDGAVRSGPGGTAPPPSSRPAASAEPVQSGEPGTPGVMGGMGGVGGRSGRERHRRRSEPYVEWKVPKGVPPVIEPGPEPKHDPGPGVIGIDR
jgi:hypothetical protein